MSTAYVLNGTVTDPLTLKLSEPVPIPAGSTVRVTVNLLGEKPSLAGLDAYLDDLGKRQAARGHVPLSREEIDDYLRGERESWEDS